MGESFIDGFCKVEFLCYHGELNWLGWVVLIPVGVVGLIVALFGLIVALLCLGYILRLVTTATTPERTAKEEKIMEYNKQLELQKGDMIATWKILLFIVLGVMALMYINNLISGSLFY